MTGPLGTRRLGGLVTSSIGLGCMRLPGGADDRASLRLIGEALERGVTLLDTAATYSDGDNERLVGRAAALGRDVVVATKFGIERDEAGSVVVDGRPATVRASCEASLGRLGLDVIDLFYQHRADPEVPIEETVGAMAELVEEGKVRYLGLCEASVDTLERAFGVHPISALQTEWSLWTRDVEAEVLPVARRLGVGVVAYSPLGRGIFTDQQIDWSTLPPDDFRRHGARYQGSNLAQNQRAVERLRAVAEEVGVTFSQLTLAWLMAQGEDVVPIPGTSRLEHLEDNLGAARVELDDDRLAQIGAIASSDAWAGERYPPGSFLSYATTPPSPR